MATTRRLSGSSASSRRGEERIVWAHYFEVAQSGGDCVAFNEVRFADTRTILWVCGVTKVEELRPVDPPKAAAE